MHDVLAPLTLPDGRAERPKVRSMGGLLPLCAVTVSMGKSSRGYPIRSTAFRGSSTRDRSCRPASTMP